MAASIMHRATGIALATGGSLLMLYWLGAIASGPSRYEVFHRLASSWFGQLVLLGFTFVIFQHMLLGLHHLYLDTGRGYEIRENRLLSIACFAGAGVLTMAVWGLSYSGLV